MIDRYTKTVLTVIALVLSVIAIGRLTPQARAQGVACGASPATPCYVSNFGGIALKVRVDQ